MIPSGSASVPDGAQQALDLLKRNQVLLAATLRVEVAGTLYQIAVSKRVDESGRVVPGFRWAVEWSTDEGLRRTTGLQPVATAEAAYTEAVAWVQAQARAD